jgi:ribosomal-protein-serine acetyltransferase
MFHVVIAPGFELRQFEQQDAEAVFATVERHRAYLREWLPWVDLTHSAAETGNFIAAKLEQFQARQGPTAAVWLDGEIVGAVGCHPIDWLNRNCHLGYWIAPGHQGKGVITRSVAALLDHLFGEMELHRVTIQCGAGNVKSCAIPRRLGFVREGVLREAQWVNDRWVDLVVWSMLAQHWKTHTRDES